MTKHKISPVVLEASRRLRRDQTPAENILWEALRDRRLGGERFKRQVVIGTFVVDFLSPRHRLVIELDGSVHDDPATRAADHEREQLLIEAGYRVLRFRNHEVEQNLPHVLESILNTLHS